MDYWPLGGRRRGFTPRVSVSSSITHRCVILVFASLFPLSLPFNYCSSCDYLWFRLFIDSVLAYVHVPHKYCLIISLNWLFANWGSKSSRCFIHYLNIQYFIIKWISHNISHFSFSNSFLNFPFFSLSWKVSTSMSNSVHHFYFPKRPDWIITLTNYFSNLQGPSWLQAQLLDKTSSTKKTIKSIQSPT